MDVLQAIKERRSVRQYSQEPVSESHLTQILEAGRWAPSRGNSQPWKFIVLNDEHLREELAEVVATGKFIAKAAQGIAVVVNPEVSKHPSGRSIRSELRFLRTSARPSPRQSVRLPPSRVRYRGC